MTVSLALTLSAILVAASQAALPDPTGQEEPYVLLNVATPLDKCNVALATKTDLLSLAREPRKWAGKCVAVEGYWQHRALFASARDTRKRYSQSNKALRARRVGIYGTEKLLSTAPRDPIYYTAIGVAGQCETLGEEAIMVMGYCHYTDGPYIAVAEMRRR